MTDSALIMREMRDQVRLYLVSCCKELTDWNRDGNLEPGRIRAIAETLIPIEPTDFNRRIRMVEYEIRQQAVQFMAETEVYLLQ